MNSIKEIIEAKNKTYKYFTKEESLEAVKQDGFALQFVNEQTKAICLEAVKQNGDALQYVKEQTEAICLEAVKQDGDALMYVKEHLFQNSTTKELTMEAVKKDTWTSS